MTTLGHGEKWHARVKSLEEAADHCTHIMPTYNPVQSKGVPYKNPILQWSLGGIRRFLLEYAYRGGKFLLLANATSLSACLASQLFPESSQYFMNESQILRVGIGAKIVRVDIMSTVSQLTCATVNTRCTIFLRESMGTCKGLSIIVHCVHATPGLVY